jgi:hypothetical protein
VVVLLLKFRCVASWGRCDRAGEGGRGDLVAVRGVNLVLLGGADGLSFGGWV